MRGLVDRDLVQRRPLDFGMRSLHALGFPRLYVGAFPIARRFGSAEADRLRELLIAHPTPDGHARRVETSAEITDQQIVGFARSSDSGTHALGPFPALAGVGPSRDAAAILGGFGAQPLKPGVPMVGPCVFLPSTLSSIPGEAFCSKRSSRSDTCACPDVSQIRLKRTTLNRRSFNAACLALTPYLAAPAPRRPQQHIIVRPDRPSSSVRPWGGLFGGFRISLRRNILARTVPQTPLAGGATDTAQAASGLISTA